MNLFSFWIFFVFVGGVIFCIVCVLLGLILRLLFVKRWFMNVIFCCFNLSLFLFSVIFFFWYFCSSVFRCLLWFLVVFFRFLFILYIKMLLVMLSIFLSFFKVWFICFWNILEDIDRLKGSCSYWYFL